MRFALREGGRTIGAGIVRDDSISYPTRTAWVDKETFIPIKQELFALSGMLLKTWSMTEVQTFDDGRRFPTRMVLTDELKKGSQTNRIPELYMPRCWFVLTRSSVQHQQLFKTLERSNRV